MIHGDCLEEMRKMSDNSISAIVTDPPYGISFMGKGWDHGVPQREYWEACLRVLKPGAYLLAMGGTRTFHRLCSAIEDAGFQIRDTIAWIYGSGFPKSHNDYGLSGYGTALKPAHEPIIMAMKPLDGTFKQNAEKWGQAGINIDGCRVEAVDQDQLAKNWNRETVTDMRSGNYGNGIASGIALSTQAPKGRWPANVIFDEEAGAMLDEQSGLKKGSGKATIGGTPRNSGSSGHILEGSHDRTESLMNYGDSGGASRFFYCAKASSRERNEGLEGLPLASNMRVNGPRESEEEKTATKVKNFHPTVKPLKLMEYLIRLVMPPKDGILLDPFAGSGTTILAAKRLGFNAIGIEKQAEYVDIARARIAQEDLFAC